MTSLRGGGELVVRATDLCDRTEAGSQDGVPLSGGNGAVHGGTVADSGRSAGPVTWHRAGHVVLRCLGSWLLEPRMRRVPGSERFPQSFAFTHAPVVPQTRSLSHSTHGT